MLVRETLITVLTYRKKYRSKSSHFHRIQVQGDFEQCLLIVVHFGQHQFCLIYFRVKYCRVPGEWGLQQTHDSPDGQDHRPFSPLKRWTVHVLTFHDTRKQGLKPRLTLVKTLRQSGPGTRHATIYLGLHLHAYIWI